MPILPENRDRYPPDWQQIRERIRVRAGDRCENCGVGNHWRGYRDMAGSFVCTGFNERLARLWPIDIAAVPPGVMLIEIVCTTAHLDHVIEDCSDANLQFLCQKCHLAHDVQHHAETRRKRKAIGDLFT